MREFSVVLAPAAEGDIEEAFHWYQRRDPAVVDAFRTEALGAIDGLAVDAMGWRIDALGNRRRLLKHFSYSVWFEVAADTVTVLAVAHHRRVPGYWRA